MIRYMLCCSKGHKFEDWFDSISVYEEKEKSGDLKCPICGDTKVTRSIMAPKVVANAVTNSKTTHAAVDKFGSSCGNACSNGSCPFTS